MSGNKKIVEIRHFKMKFGYKTVIKDLSFDVFQGEVFGFLGSNGSGKTTTLRALLGLYEPAAGDLLINGKPYAVENQLSLGYLPEERGLYKKEKVLDVMIYFGQLKGLNRNEAKEFSLRCPLGCIKPTYEPTKGFDPVNRRLLMNIIEEQRKAGTTIIYVTHQMEEVEQLCDRLILLKDGQAAAYGTLAEVKKQFGGASMDDIFVKVYGGEDKELGDE